MSIIIQSIYGVECGGCGIQFFPRFRCSSPESAMRFARRRGWQMEGGDHRCPECGPAMDALQAGQAEGWWTLGGNSEWTADVGGFLVQAETPALLLVRCQNVVAGLVEICR